MLMDRIEEEGRQIGRGRQGAGNSGREAESRRRRRCHQIEGRRRRRSREEEPTSRIRSERERVCEAAPALRLVTASARATADDRRSMSDGGAAAVVSEDERRRRGCGGD